MPFPARTIALWAALIAASGLLGFGLKLGQFPAAFLLGPMIAAIVFGVRGAPLRMPRPAFQASQAMIGCMVAHAITAEITKTLIADGPLILLVVGVTVLAGALVGLVLTRLRVLPGTTAAWGSSPGGAAAMVAVVIPAWRPSMVLVARARRKGRPGPANVAQMAPPSQASGAGSHCNS